MPNAIVLGDKATCLGPVAFGPAGPSTVYINGESVAREGVDLVHGAPINGILGKSSEVYVEGAGIAFVGDSITPHTVGDSDHKDETLDLSLINTTVFVGEQ